MWFPFLNAMASWRWNGAWTLPRCVSLPDIMAAHFAYWFCQRNQRTRCSLLQQVDKWIDSVIFGFAISINVCSNFVHHFRTFPRYNITPVVTMYHWELPSSIQDLGGWTNPIIIDYITDYANILFQLFGDRVKVNYKNFLVMSISMSCDELINILTFISSIGLQWTNHGRSVTFPMNMVCRELRAIYVVIMCWKHTPKSFICIAINFNQSKMVKSVLRFIHRGANRKPIPLKTEWHPIYIYNFMYVLLQMKYERINIKIVPLQLGWFAHPIFSESGNYPPIMIERIKANSRMEGLSRSWLPTFTQDEIARIRGTADFFGLNTYTTRLVTLNDKSNSANFSIPSFQHDMGVVQSIDTNWPKDGGTSWIYVRRNARRKFVSVGHQFRFVVFRLCRPG